MKYCLILFLSVLSFQSNAQDFIIKNNHDTIPGEIHLPAPAYYLHDRVFFMDPERGEIEYHPMDLAGFRVNAEMYETHDIGIEEPLLQFMKVVVKGKCSVYEYEKLTNHHSLHTKVFLLQKEGEPFHEFNYKAIKKGRDDYFSDNESLVQDIQNGVFKKGDVKRIVMLYNKGS